MCSEIGNKYDWAFVNISLRPYYGEGSKTFGFEIAEQLGWHTPDHVIVPAAGGSLIAKIHKAFQEFYKIGLLEEEPHCRLTIAQGAGCAPIVNAIKEKTDFIKPVKPTGIAKSLAIGNPADGFYAKEVVEKTNGFAEAISDEEIVAGIKLLAETEGIFTETAGGVTIGALKRLAEAGKFDPEATIVVAITGHGLKTQEAVADALTLIPTINPTLDDFEKEMMRNFKL